MNIATTLATALLSTVIATSGFAAGSDSTSPPSTTKTTSKCKDGEVWDRKSQKCVQSDAHNLTDDDRYKAARELAYAGQYNNAMKVLNTAKNQNDPRILNYKGFTNRKLGNVDLAMTFYQKAISENPDYILARSYMGQGLVAQGDLAGALAQLKEIKTRGGQDTWAYASLEKALLGESSDW